MRPTIRRSLHGVTAGGLLTTDTILAEYEAVVKTKKGKETAKALQNAVRETERAEKEVA